MFASRFFIGIGVAILSVFGISEGVRSIQTPYDVYTYSTDEIVKVDGSDQQFDVDEDGVLVLGDTRYKYDLYKNLAYTCGGGGNHTFMVLQREDSVDKPVDTWTFFRAGKPAFYYDPPGSAAVVSVGEDGSNSEEGFGSYLSFLFTTDASGEGRFINQNSSTGFHENVLGRRLAEGSRIILPSKCDLDVYAGLGHEYTNNPNGDTSVEGGLASAAAIDYTINNYPGSGDLWLYGNSGGSIGAYIASRAMMEADVRAKGVLLDSSFISSYSDDIIMNQCAPYEERYAKAGFTPEQLALSIADKIGLFAQEQELFLENFIGDPNGVPYYVTGGSDDTFCCGPGKGSNYEPLSPEVASIDGGNCGLVYSALDAGLDRDNPIANLSRKNLITDNVRVNSHVVTNFYGADAERYIHQDIEDWINEVKRADLYTSF